MSEQQQEKLSDEEELLKLLAQLKKEINETTMNTGYTRPNSWNATVKQNWEDLIDQSTNKVQNYSKQSVLSSNRLVELESENATLKQQINNLEKRLKLFSLISKSNDEQVDELMTQLAKKNFFNDDGDDQGNEGNNSGGNQVV